MKINVKYIPDPRYYRGALKLKYKYRFIDGHLKAVSTYKTILVDITDIPF